MTNELICPCCGSKLKLQPVEVPSKIRKFDEKLLTKHMKLLFGTQIEIIEISDNLISFKYTGKYNKTKFNKILVEVKGFGGRYNPSQFIVPISNLGIEENVSQ